MDPHTAREPWCFAGRERWRLAVALYGDRAPVAFVPDLVLEALVGAEAVLVRESDGRESRYTPEDRAHLILRCEVQLPVDALRLPPLTRGSGSAARGGSSWRRLLRKERDLLRLHPLVRRGLRGMEAASDTHSVDACLVTPVLPLGPPLVVEALWRHRPDLQDAFPHPASYDFDRLLDWAATRGVKEAGLQRSWLPRAPLWSPPHASPAGHTRLHHVAVVRLADDAKGVAVAGRRLVAQLRTSGVHVDDVATRLENVTALPRTEAQAVVIAVNADHTERVLRRLRVPRGTPVIGYWWWESTYVPDNVRRAAHDLHCVWAPTDYVGEVLQSAVPSLLRVPPPIPDAGPSPEGSGAAFTFLVDVDANSSLFRKNPQGSVEAFLQAFPSEREDVALVVRTRNGRLETLAEMIRGRRDISLLHEELTAEEHARLVSSVDVVLSLHRSEGFGLLLAEALTLGKLVVATAWSGSSHLAGHKGFWDVPYHLVERPDPTGIYPGTGTWAEPDISAAGELLRRAVSLRSERPWRLAGPAHLEQLRLESKRWEYVV